MRCLIVMCRHFDNINTVANYEYISSVVTISITIVISVSVNYCRRIFNCIFTISDHCLLDSSYSKTSANRRKRKLTISLRRANSLRLFMIHTLHGVIFCEGNLLTTGELRIMWYRCMSRWCRSFMV